MTGLSAAQRVRADELLDVLFGVAKLLAVEDRDLTRTAGAPLTPSSAAPEQLLGGTGSF